MTAAVYKPIISQCAGRISPYFGEYGFSIMEIGNVCDKVEKVFRRAILEMMTKEKEKFIPTAMEDFWEAKSILIDGKNEKVQAFMQTRFEAMQTELVGFLKNKAEGYKIERKYTQSKKEESPFTAAIEIITRVLELLK